MLRKRGYQRAEASCQHVQTLPFHPGAHIEHTKTGSFRGIACLVLSEVCVADEAEVSQVGLEI